MNFELLQYGKPYVIKPERVARITPVPASASIQQQYIEVRKVATETARRDLVAAIFEVPKLLSAFLSAMWQETRSQIGVPTRGG